ncbi:lysozyme inhibitor [Chryseobacterium sp. SNU WT5]|uniref:lysozyme inhibitor n=1 Tax=Chryseobacterium sp. SNU WT5 TaxID=2594269 RepID=UPI00118118B7|nr:lysozyme inhibitor [Chryseobacterium sp. SNU WT5]QDP84163.1 lysozyme inhibitor [Chryseobacterium sp. SNU WT5]
MKQLPVLLSLIAALVISCNKKDTTEEVAQTQNEIVMDTVVSVDTVSNDATNPDEMNLQNDANTYIYKAEDGTLATVIFLNTDSIHTLTVKMNDKEYVLNQTEAWAKGADYEKDGVKAHSQRDDLDLTMAGKTIKLKRQYDKK